MTHNLNYNFLDNFKKLLNTKENSELLEKSNNFSWVLPSEEEQTVKDFANILENLPDFNEKEKDFFNQAWDMVKKAYENKKWKIKYFVYLLIVNIIFLFLFLMFWLFIENKIAQKHKNNDLETISQNIWSTCKMNKEEVILKYDEFIKNKFNISLQDIQYYNQNEWKKIITEDIQFQIDKYKNQQKELIVMIFIFWNIILLPILFALWNFWNLFFDSYTSQVFWKIMKEMLELFKRKMYKNWHIDMMKSFIELENNVEFLLREHQKNLVIYAGNINNINTTFQKSFEKYTQELNVLKAYFEKHNITNEAFEMLRIVVEDDKIDIHEDYLKWEYKTWDVKYDTIIPFINWLILILIFWFWVYFTQIKHINIQKVLNSQIKTMIENNDITITDEYKPYLQCFIQVQSFK